MRSIFLSIMCFCALLTQAQKDVTVPDVSNFDTSAGSQSSVNLSNGKLSFPLKLVSLKGYKDLAVNFGIAYDGSQVPKHAKASNEIIPTGVLGLGWGMQMPRILADNKLTAARDDDQFYLFEGGSLNELFAISKTNSYIDFETKTFKPWKVRFYNIQERWEVTKENGYKYTYDYVDWVLYWENWIGNTNASNADRQGSGWSLTSVEDMYGNQVTYDYISVLQNLSGSTNSNHRHTEATYLKSITGALGERVELIYNEKMADEYYEPNTNAPEPDAYQEMYEKKFLQSVEAYDPSNQLLYSYDFNYNMVGNGEHKKRFLDNIQFVTANNETQTYREFEYDTNTNSDYYGLLQHQILPTKGRISYQYATKEVEIDQIFEVSGNDKTSFVIQKNYILKLTYVESGGNKYLYVNRIIWDGNTWSEEQLGDPLPGILKGNGYLDVQVMARENFFVILYRVNGTNYYRRAFGLKDDGVTWSENSGEVATPEAGNPNTLSLLGGEDFFAVCNSGRDRINMYQWNGTSWSNELLGNDSTGEFFYTAANNYVLQHIRDAGYDTLKIFYYDILNNIQVKNFNWGVNTDGSGDHPSYWYGSHSFAQVNANANPEYFIRWDKDYNYIDKDEAPFGSIPDDIKTQGLFNNYYASAKKAYDFENGVHNDTYVTRYTGNGNWAMSFNNTSAFIYDKNLTGFGNDFYVHPSDYFSFNYPDQPIKASNNVFNVFNANTGLWEVTSLAVQGNTNFENDKLSFDAFASKYGFANAELYKINSDLSISDLVIYPSNTIFSKSDGGNNLYISSRRGSNGYGTAFAKLLSLRNDNQISEVDLPNGFYLHKNAYKSFPSHASGYGTFVLSNSSNSAFKIYKLVDGKIEYNADNNPVQKDIVIVKETFDPVLSRKQRKYFCYSNPKLAKDNLRTFYSTVIQQNDLEGVLGGSVTFYNSGLEDIRMQGLPIKIQSFDAEFNLISEQENYWRLRTPNNRGSYYLNTQWKKTKSYEGSREFSIRDYYEYHLSNGLLKKHKLTRNNEEVVTTQTTYLYEEEPSVLDVNLLQPVVYSKQYEEIDLTPSLYTNATAVKWDVTGVPYPKKNYGWMGEGSISFDFNNPPPNFRESQEIVQLDTYGNILEEKNRSEVVTSYLYGYNNKRLVAKIEGATYAQVTAQVNNSILNNPASDEQLRNELQNLRSALSNAYVTYYTYHLGIGVTSKTDVRGRTLKYIYDDYYRLSHIIDHEGNILKKNNYEYREAPFTYSSESTEVLDCPLITTVVVGNPDGSPPEPLTLNLTKQSGTSGGSFYVVTASDGGNYNFIWHYTVTQGSTSHFPYIANGNHLSSTNPDCNDGVLSIRVTIENGSGEVIASSNIVNHTYAPTGSELDCMNH